jgi:hypothetical protein
MKFPPQAWLFVALVGCGSIVPAPGDGADAAAAPAAVSPTGASKPKPSPGDQGADKGGDKHPCERDQPPCGPSDQS